MLLWLGFLLCTAAIVYAGAKLAKYGDIIAEKTGLGRTWIGVMLMASVTSLPELVTGISSVTYAAAPDIAVGDVLGSCVFNMLILAMLDAFHRETPISARAHHGNILSAGLGILMLCTVAMCIFAQRTVPALGWIGSYTVVIVILYLIAMRLIFVHEKRRITAFVKDMAVELKYQTVTFKQAVIVYTINAIVVIIAAVFLPEIGKGIAESTGLGQTFVGNTLIAVSTSLPEVVVSFSAMRMGAVDLAIGNLLGSNIFNVFILALDDFFFTQGPILSFVNPSHMISAISAIAMTAVAVVGLTYRAEKKLLFLAWDSVVIILLYIINVMILSRLI